MRKFLVISTTAILAFFGASPSALGAPGKPTGVTVTSKSTTGTSQNAASVEVKWTASSNAVAYSVIATADNQTARSGGTPTCAELVCTSVVANLAGGVAYNFLVTAIDNAGLTAKADEVKFTTISVPGAPTNLSATAGANQITLSWTAPVNTGGLPITEYAITDGGGISKTATANSSSYVVTNVSAGTPYTFKIKAVNSNGSSTEGIFATLVSLALPTAPGTPTAITSGSSILVSWATPADGGSPLTGFKIFVIKSDGTDLGDAHLVSGATTTAGTVTGIAAGTYTVKVLATNAVGDSPRSPASAAVTVSADLTTQAITFNAISPKTYPGTFTVSANATSSLTVTFSAVGSCSISGLTVTLLGIGTCSITAAQAGNSTYAAATSVVRSFTITQASSGSSGSSGGSGGGFSGGGSTPVVTPTPAPSPTGSATPSPSPSNSPVLVKAPAKVLNTPSKVTSSDVKALSGAQLAAIPASTLNKLPVAVFASISATQAKSFTSTQLNLISNTALIKLQPKSVAAIPSTVIAKLSLAKLTALTNAQVKAMTAAQLKVLSKAQRKALGR